jgi:hypothetical protein
MPEETLKAAAPQASSPIAESRAIPFTAVHPLREMTLPDGRMPGRGPRDRYLPTDRRDRQTAAFRRQCPAPQKRRIRQPRSD